MDAVVMTTAQPARFFQPLCLRTHRVTNALILLLVPVQFYAAGFGIFRAGSMVPHAIIGWSLILVALISVISAALARRGRGDVGRAFAVLALIILQPVLVHGLRYTLPELAALHAVNGLAIGVLAFVIHRRLRPASGR
jgi:hypothetical membrane protein